MNEKENEETEMSSGKLIEYLGSGTTIINFSNSANESQEVLKLSPKSFNAHTTSIKLVVDFIQSEYNNWKAGNYKKQSLKNIDLLSRASLT